MALWDQLKARLTDLQATTTTQVGKFKSKDFAKASMAMCALIAAADGTITHDERLLGDLMTLLDDADAHVQRQVIDSVRALGPVGRKAVTPVIGKLKSKPEAARAVIQVGIIIGGADGNFDEDEKRAVREACNAVGIAPAEFDL